MKGFELKEVFVCSVHGKYIGQIRGYVRTEMLNNCQTNGANTECSECPSTSTSNEKMEEAMATILKNRKMVMDHVTWLRVLSSKEDMEKTDQPVQVCAA
jgi:hypothetical protein